MLPALAFVCLATSAFIVAEVLSFGARQRSAALRRAAGYGHVRVTVGPDRLRFRERVVVPLAVKLAALTLRLNPRLTAENVRHRLLSAGLSGRVSVQMFLAAKAFFAIFFLLLGLAISPSFGFPVGVLFAGAFAAGGFALPGIVVSGRARKRKEEIRAQLPDALDLLAVSVEAGLGFDGALDKITDQMDGALSEEFALTLGEMRIGESRHEALKKLAERVDTPEVAGFSRAIIQADQLGISLGRILKVQAADSRSRRQAAAEERAMKAPIKMLFPTVAFIFPAMFLVILGPALLNLREIF
jgi:tight adherence protein C